MLGQNRGTHRHCLRKVDGDRELLAVIWKIVEFRGVPQLSDVHWHENLGGVNGFAATRVVTPCRVPPKKTVLTAGLGQLVIR